MFPVDLEERRERRVRRISAALLVLVAATVVLIVFMPAPPDRTGQRNLVGFLARSHRQGLPTWIDFSLIETAANVAMFVPLGFLAALARRRRPWLVVLAAAVVSGLIETGQLLFLTERVASLHDVAANTAGALLGLLLAAPVLRRRRLRRRRAALGRRRARDRPRTIRAGRRNTGRAPVPAAATADAGPPQWP